MTLPNRSQIATLAQLAFEIIIHAISKNQINKFSQGLAISSSDFLKIFETTSSLPLYIDN